MRQLLAIEAKKGYHTELVTLYVAADRNKTDLLDTLKAEASESENIKDKTNRQNVISAIDKLIHYVRHNSIDANGICLFATHNELYTMIPPHKNTINRYICDKFFNTSHLRNLINRAAVSYGLVALDGSECTIGMLTGKSVTILHELQSGVKNRVIKGGQSARRYRNARDESVNYYHKEVSDLLNNYFDTENIKRVYFGGILPSSEQYLKTRPGLLSSIAKKLSRCYPIPFTDRMGLNVLLKTVKDDIEQSEQAQLYEESLKERKILEQIVESQKYCTIDNADLCRIFINEDKILEVPLDKAVITKIPITVYTIDSLAYDYLKFNFSGIMGCIK